jgi:hypothetical protein
MQSPFKITVYDGAFVRKGFVGDPVALIVTPRHNALGTAMLTVDSDHVRLADLFAPGARAVIDYEGRTLLTGRVRLRAGAGPELTGTLTFTIVDDLRLLWRVLGWPDPASVISDQTLRAYDTRTGPAETVLKDLVTANAVTRLGLPVAVTPDLGRGSEITAAVRMHPLADRLMPLVDAAGIGVTVRQSGSGLELDCYTPTLHPRTLSEGSGVVTSWSYSQADPEATRTVVGGPGEGTARQFHSVTDASRETDWADLIEVFRDARDVDADQTIAEIEAQLDLRGQQLLDEAVEKNGLKVTLAETSTFRYGQAVSVGDRVRIEVGPDVVVEDVLREAVLSWTRDDGLVVTPQVGERLDSDTVLARAVAALGRGIRNLTAGR